MGKSDYRPIEKLEIVRVEANSILYILQMFVGTKMYLFRQCHRQQLL